ncbi:MAG TPA: glutathione S-transferase family protein [Candidatus Udaeobacter sp.]|jgi:putative glutathione S-transferase|nr:glutathione S-transferase family protein [Candidatus Udaeobacter sp.]
MGLMIEGKWDDDVTIPSDARGHFIRESSRFRHWITPDGSPGPSKEGGFPAEPNRYHLFVSPSCPWAHRTIIMRKLKRLEGIVSISIADRAKTEGWAYSQPIDNFEPCPDGIFRLYQVYAATDTKYTGKVTVPTLWDRKRRQIVNNESSEIIRMFNSAFNAWTDVTYDFYPEALRDEIDRINEFVYSHLNNGVYRAGFARTQVAYDEAVRKVFHGLDTLEQRLTTQRYLTGERITEADWRAFPTLLRFDLVYYGHFKCNLRRVQDYPNLANYLRELYQWPGIKETFELEKIKAGYYSQRNVNPTGIVPLGPALDHLEQPHDRERLRAAA